MSSDTIFQLLRELLKNSKRSDRDLAKSLGVSQPTLTRMRKRLEKEGYILERASLKGKIPKPFSFRALEIIS